MKALLWFSFFAGLAYGCKPDYSKAKVYEWTGVNGETFKAKFVSATDETVTIIAKGKTYVMTMSSLSPESQAQARRLAGQGQQPWKFFLVPFVIIVAVAAYLLLPFGQDSFGRSDKPKHTWVPPWENKKESAREWDLVLLQKLEWKRFEELTVAYAQSKSLYCIPTRHGADGGVDMYVSKSEEKKPFAVIQCKAWHTRNVGVKPVRELLGVVTSEGVSKGIFMSSGPFTREAVEFAREQPLELIDGAEFISRIKKLPEADRQKLFSLATAGDYTTPTCPNCNVKMVDRQAKKGVGAGSRFWGCRNYPRCKQTFKHS